MAVTANINAAITAAKAFKTLLKIRTKKAQMGGPRKPISLLMGLGFLALGLLPLLNKLGVVSFTLFAPGTIGGTVLYVLAIVGAVFLLWDAISEGMAMMGFAQMVRMATFVMALVLLAIGLIPLLHGMNVIGFTLPDLGDTILNILFTITGFLLLYGGTQGF